MEERIEEFYDKLKELTIEYMEGIERNTEEYREARKELLRHRFDLLDEYSEDLYKNLSNKFNQFNIKNCINFDDYNYEECISDYLKHGKRNDFIEKDVQAYKVLLKGHSGMTLFFHVTALYVPIHINAIYVNGLYKIPINIEPSDESNKNLDLQDILDASKKLPTYESFDKIYKKVILMEPFIPMYTMISYGTRDIFYYEAIISDNVFINSAEMRNDDLTILCELNSCCYELNESLFNDNKILKFGRTDLMNRECMQFDTCFVKSINDYFIIKFDEYRSNLSLYISPNKYDKFYKEVYDDAYNHEYDLYLESTNHNNKILTMFLTDRESYTERILSRLPF